MRVLLTRPQAESDRTAEALRVRGHEGVVAPVLQIEPVRDVTIEPKSAAALMITSANAALALAGHPERNALLKLPVLAVGARTAAAARDAGFGEVISAQGDASDLAALAARRFGDRGASLLYLAGSDRARDLPGDLAQHGIAIETAVVYTAHAATSLPRAARDALLRNSVSGVLHYSARSASIFLECVARDGLMETAAALTHYCLSERVAGVLERQRFSRIRTAGRPDEQTILDLLDRA